MAMAIRDLSDLVYRISKESSFKSDSKEEAENQFRFLQMATKDAKLVSAESTVQRRELDCFKELETLVQRAESEEIAGSKEARVEFDRLIMAYRSAGYPLYERKQQLSQTIHPYLKDNDTHTTIENEKDLVKKIFTLRRSPQAKDNSDIDIQHHMSSSDTNRVSIPKEEYTRLQNSEEILKTKVEELSNRLSKFASDRMTDHNPNLADLSDANRPTKIGERIGELYDNQWSDAYEDLRNLGMEDLDILHTLFTIIKLSQWFCKSVSDQQLEQLSSTMKASMVTVKWWVPDIHESYEVERPSDHPTALSSVSRFAKDFRKTAALASVPALCVLFKDVVFRSEFSKINYNKYESIDKYIDECVRCMWLMHVQDPPMQLIWQQNGEPVDLNFYRFYETKGKIVKQCVWPAVLLYNGGPVISKGYVLPVPVVAGEEEGR